MTDIIMLTGGARSGKSTFALKIAKNAGARRAIIATGVATDDEMDERIAKHRLERKDEFDTFEQPEELAGLLRDIAGQYDVILIDCVTFFINNIMHGGVPDQSIINEFEEILKIIVNCKCTAIFVTNEVGLGIVPDNPLARRFRDMQGRVNQMIAEAADKVFLMVSGIPVEIKRHNASYKI